MDRKGKLICGVLEDELAGPILTRDYSTLNSVINSLSRHDADILYLVVFDQARRVIAHTFPDNKIPAFILNQVFENSPVFFRDKTHGLCIRQYSNAIQSGAVGTIVIGLDNNVLTRKLNRLSATLIIMVSLAVLFMAAILVISISWLIIHPIRGLVRGFKQFAPGGPLLNTMEAASRDALLKIIETEKLAGIGVLASGVAHEINNPIAGIEACAYRLLRNDNLGSKQREYVDLILNSARHIQAVTRDLLQYARHPGQKEEKVELRHVAAFAIKLLHYRLEKNNINIVADFPDFPCIVLGIRAGLVQVVINGLLNALDASKIGDSIEVKIVEQETIYKLEITDQGAGVDPAIHSKVFDPFFTTKGSHGTGLGLYVSYTIIRSHGGKINLTSANGRGATLTVELPRVVGETIATAPAILEGEGI
jgi:two-component system NtrC family sensor kinase